MLDKLHPLLCNVLRIAKVRAYNIEQKLRGVGTTGNRVPNPTEIPINTSQGPEIACAAGR